MAFNEEFINSITNITLNEKGAVTSIKGGCKAKELRRRVNP